MNLSKQEPNTTTNTTTKPADHESGLLDWFMVDFWPRFGMQTTYALIGIAVMVSVGVWYNNDRISSQAKANKLLGPAYILLSEDKVVEAESFLTTFIKKGHTSLVQDKANLMLGQIHFNKAKYDDAIKAFSSVDLSSTTTSLISSGALHGLAASYMQKKDYKLAAENLEKFVSNFGRRTGAPSEKVEGQEVVDLSPAVPNALWKLTLCYRELKNTEKEKATAQKLIKIYPESKESFDAIRLSAQLP